METQEIKLKKLKELLKMLDDSLTREEFVESFKNVVNQVLRVEKSLNAKITQNLSDINARFSSLKGEVDSYTASEIKSAISDLQAKVEKKMKEEEAMMNVIRDKIRSVKDGVKGDKGESGRNGKDGRDGSPDTPSQILDKISGLLEINDVKGLKEALEELRKIREERRIFGGGFSKMAMDYRILDPYTPTGTINGTNTDFTLTKTPNPSGSLKVYRGGALQSLTEDYTVSGTTITFLVAPVVGEILKVEHRI